MAKDAKGHGSNARGGSYPNIERSAFRKNRDGTQAHVGYGDGTYRISKYGNPGSATAYVATEQNGLAPSFYGNSLGHISQQLSDRAAAKELARGSTKSGVVPVHGGATGRK